MPTERIWINGQVMPLAEARISVEDRGFQFADGVYEVIRLYDGRPFTLTEHLARLKRSADAVEIELPLTEAELAEHITRFIAAYSGDGMIYLQLTRGNSPRNHPIPEESIPTLLFYTRPLPVQPAPGAAPGVKLLEVPDERWKRCWIKTIALLPNVLAKTKAVRQGYDEAVFVDDGIVTECSASNVCAIIKGRLVTHPVGPRVLPGVTRTVLFDCAKAIGIDVDERPPTVAEMLAADELFITSTTRELSWVAQWNEHIVASKCGATTLALHRQFQARVRQELTRQANRVALSA